MSFLSPIWFFALAALSIPVLIHLWNIRPGKTLKVGSISLITEASKNTSRSFKLMDLLLLLLRCLLLALVAIFLASPVWMRNPESEKAKGWVLLPKENFKECYQKFKPKADSLIKAGYQLHYFNKGFLKIDTAKPLATADTRDTASTSNYWSLIRQLDQQLPASIPVVLFTPNGLNHFSGEKPSVNLNLKWHTYTAADSASKWIAGAWFTTNNAIKVTVGASGPSGTHFTDKFIHNEGDDEIAVSIKNGQPLASFKLSGESPVKIDTTTFRIAVYTNKYSVDAAYLSAALNAVLKFKGRKYTIRQYGHADLIPGEQGWLFWLSDDAMGNGVKNKAKHIFKYESSKAINVSTWINGDNNYALPNGDQKISLTNLIGTNKKNQSVWQDGFGRPVLDLEKKPISIYHFYTHFNPAWNDLVWNDDFPKMMLRLIDENASGIPPEYDKRILSNKRLQPNKITEIKETATVKPVQKTDLSKYFWLLLIIIFIAERWLAHKTKPQVND